MAVLTIHALDAAVEKRIRAKARKEGKSLNRAVKELLAERVGVGAPSAADRRTEFAEFAGIWSEDDEREFGAATAACGAIDREDW